MDKITPWAKIRAGEAVRNEREAARRCDPTKVKEAYQHATICGSCAKPLKPMEPVKIGRARVTLAEAYYAPYNGRYVPEQWALCPVPFCIVCWLTKMRDADDRPRREALGRCGGCGRPIRVPSWSRTRRWMKSRATCCADCEHTVELARLRTIRKVEHATVECKVCGKPFVQKRSDAVTCSATCRQKLHRASKALHKVTP